MTMKHILLILSNSGEIYLKALQKEKLPCLKIILPKNGKETLLAADIADIWLGEPKIIRKYLKRGQNLKWVQSTFAGVDGLTVNPVRCNFKLTNVKKSYNIIMAEFVMAYILMFEKEILQNLKDQQNHRWNIRSYSSPAGKTLGIAGAGSIGSDIARHAKCFNMKTWGLKQSEKPVKGFDRIFTNKEIKTFLSGADYIVSVLPHTPKTNGFFNKKTFNMMKPEAVFMNIGRGNAVADEDLMACLKSNKLKAAVLDVFDKEPLPKNSPLWNAPGIFITPHSSGRAVSDNTIKIFVENYNRYIKGINLKYQVDWIKGY